MAADPTAALFEPIAVGKITIRNRVAMAPMTRQRSRLDGVPNDLNVEYYASELGPD